MVHVFSVGHGTADRPELLGRLAFGDVRLVVDIRTAPGSRRHPHLSRDALALWLPAEAVAYRWEPRLGGFRRPPADSPDVVWRNESFRGYAAHLRQPEALAALAELAIEARQRPTAYMCSETVWWRCHRRLVSDALMLLHDLDVYHLMPAGAVPHRPTPGVRVAHGMLMYDEVPERDKPGEEG